jgi:hypothetical protein
LKKISYGLRFGLIGTKNSGKEILVNYLEKQAIEISHFKVNGMEEGCEEYFIVFKQIPIKIKAYLANSLNDFIYNVEKINSLDAIMLVLTINDVISNEQYKSEDFKDFCKDFSFEGVSVLAAMNIGSSSTPQLKREDLITKAKELNVIYCFEIRNNDDDLKEFYEKIFNDFIFKFQYSSSELFDKAKKYGNLIK